MKQVFVSVFLGGGVPRKEGLSGRTWLAKTGGTRAILGENEKNCKKNAIFGAKILLLSINFVFLQNA
ncbi:MAG: hypothetical protein IIU85_03895 [Rikenellaceae bacterium]|nr:hypothetical protein [Rikenellaceae bacterium]